MATRFETQCPRSIGDWRYRIFQYSLGYPSIWVAGGVASLVVFVQWTLALPLQWQPALFVFAATLIPYNLDRIADSYLQEMPDRAAQGYFRRGWGWLVLIAAVVVLASLLVTANDSVLLVTLGGSLALLYGLPILPWWQQRQPRWVRLKELIPATKSWIVAAIVTYALLGIPLAYAEVAFSPAAALTGYFLLIFVGTNAHLFDVRDLDADRQAGVVTLPLLVGVAGNRAIWLLLNLSTILAVGWGWAIGLAVPPPEVVFTCVGANLALLHWTRPDTNRAFFDVYIDGSLFLPCLLLGAIRMVGWH